MAVESALVNSIVGPGTHLKGHFTVQGLLRIDGDFSGSIKTDGRVIIGRGGRADCTMDVATVVIGGVFRGTIYATDKVIALESALILGNVYSPRFIVESGVLFDGAVHIRGESRATPGEDAGTAGHSGGVARPAARFGRRARTSSGAVGVRAARR